MNVGNENRDVTQNSDSDIEAMNSHIEKLECCGRKLRSVIVDLTAKLAFESDQRKITADRADKLSAEYELLKMETTALACRNREISLISKMNDFLRSSNTEAEAYSVISEALTQLFPEDSGALYILNASRDMLETATAWGALAPANLVFSPNDCWAYRRGQSHLVLMSGQRCAHVADENHMYVCMPLIAQGETLGVLHLMDGPIRNNKRDEARMTGKSNLARTLADNIGLGIANLRARETIRNLSIRDPLTGLFNRRYMEEALAQELHRAKRSEAQAAVIMIDIDHFKAFNDNFGHDAGDAILRALGRFMQKHVRGSDIACRYGGEEFLLILFPSTAEGARQRAEQIRQGAALLSVAHASGELGGITLSLGMSIFPDHAPEAAMLIKAADVALYKAKSSGRNRVAVHSAQAAPVLA